MSGETADNAMPTDQSNQHNDDQDAVPKIGEFPTIESFTKNGLSLVVEATKAVNLFPSGATRDLYCAYPTFGKVVDAQSDRILGIISEVLKNQNIKGNIQRRQKDEQFELLLECNDTMLERINSNLDELAGIKKTPQTILVESKLSATAAVSHTRRAGSWNIKKPDHLNAQGARLITAKNIARPQISFKIPVDNSPHKPFEPRIKDKPNSLKPLAVLPEYDEDGNIESYLHPYEFELDKFEPPQSQLQESTPEFPKEVETTDLAFIDDEEKLKELLNDIKHEKEIAVDLEHHSYRSFQGITCLMQISTRSKDYIIDALKLRDELHVLNDVFTNPKILKIFHGADLDIEWLQRDLCLYVVNMFDTHQAAKLLSFPRLSLAFLLKHYCGIEADKTFQLADWRIRPLPDELVQYARRDTHFLIYIYELLRNDLLKKGNNQLNLLKMVYQKSTEICKKRYIKPKIHADSHLELYRKSKRVFDNRQLYALKGLFLWRDQMSRQEDESYGYVLPNHMMLQISENLPREMQGILAFCNPIPPLVRQNLHFLHQIVLKAREQPLVKDILEDVIVNRVVVPTTKDFNSKLYCPHDLSHNPEFRDDLPTLLGSTNTTNNVEDDYCQQINMVTPTITVFECVKKADVLEIEEKLQKLKEVKFVTPYERYKAVIPYAEKERQEELLKENEINSNKLLCPVKKELVDVDETQDDSKRETNDDIYSVPLKETLKRKRTKNIDSENVNSKKLRNNTSLEEGDKLEFIPKVKCEGNKDSTKADKSTVFTINVKNDVKATVENGSSSDVAAEENNEVTTNTIQDKIINDKNTGGKNKKKRKFKNKNKSEQSSTQPVQFDYSKVSFKKFQGGSKKAQGTEIKSKFQGKGQGNKVNNKKFNKLFTFSNVKNKK